MFKSWSPAGDTILGGGRNFRVQDLVGASRSLRTGPGRERSLPRAPSSPSLFPGSHKGSSFVPPYSSTTVFCLVMDLGIMEISGHAPTSLKSLAPINLFFLIVSQVFIKETKSVIYLLNVT